MKYALIAFGVLLVFAIVGKKAGWFGKSEDVKVSVEEVDTRSITQTVLANGKVMPETEIKLSSEVSGEVIHLAVRDGDSVYKGDLLVVVNPELVEAALDRTRATVNSAKANLNNAKARARQVEANFKSQKKIWERTQSLYKKEVISEDEYLRAKYAYEASGEDYKAALQSVEASAYNVESTMASLKEVNESLSRTSVYSPIDGIVTKLNIEEGERVVGTAQMQGTEMLRVADLSVMQARVDVSEADIVAISLGDTSIIEVDAYPDQKFRGIVSEIANSANSMGLGSNQVTNFGVKIDLLPESYENLGKERRIPFRPGLSASVEIMTMKRNNVISVPIQCVSARVLDEEGKVKRFSKGDGEDEEKEGTKGAQIEEVIFAVEDSKVVSYKVKTGIQDDTYIEILSGLEKGQLVITGPFSAISKKLADKMKVDVVDKDKLFAE